MRQWLGPWVAALVTLAGCASERPDTSLIEVQGRIEWDQSTLTFLTPGGYARIARVSENRLMMSYEDGGRSFVRHSNDEGKTWSAPILAAEFAHGAAANPQPLVRRDGSVWLLYNERPRPESGEPFTIRLNISRDGGETWTPRERPLFVAGTRPEEGCWEPSAIELDDEVLVFFADESPYPHSAEQQITMLRTQDGGETFSEPTPLAFRAGARDGMPVPTRLSDGSVAVAVEDSGLTPDGQMKPVILHLPLPIQKSALPRRPGDPDRWPAIERTWRDGLYVGAPYLVTMPGGITLLSVQSVEFDREQRMVVYVGDAGARRFSHPTQPFRVDSGHSGKWNSLFVKNARTVTAISGTTIGGSSGIWTIDGHVGR